MADPSLVFDESLISIASTERESSFNRFEGASRGVGSAGIYLKSRGYWERVSGDVSNLGGTLVLDRQACVGRLVECGRTAIPGSRLTCPPRSVCATGHRYLSSMWRLENLYCQKMYIRGSLEPECYLAYYISLSLSD